MELQEQQSPLTRAIELSLQISDAFQEILGNEATLDIRGRLAMAYLSISLDHREAILLLVSCGAYSSATALHRPLLESFITGAWIDNNATDKEVENIAALLRPPPKFETMSQQLRKTHPLGHSFEVLREHYGILGDYTHGHVRQLSRWLGPRGVGPQYCDGQMIEVLWNADFVGLLAAVHRENILDRPTNRLLDMLDTLMDIHKSRVKDSSAR